MTQEHPPELKGFHARNMRQALLVRLIPVAAGSGDSTARKLLPPRMLSSAD